MAANKDIRDMITIHLKSIQRSVAWLSEQTKIPYNTLYFILSRKERTLTDVNKEKINAILKTKF